MAIPLGEMMAQPGTPPDGGPQIMPDAAPQPAPEVGAIPAQGTSPQIAPGGGAAPPEPDNGEYTPDEDQLLTKLTTAAEELIYRDDGMHAAAMKMINESLNGNPPEGLASSTLMVVDQVEKRVTGYDNQNNDLPMVTAEGGIPDEVLPGFAMSVYDMVWELATVQQGIDLSGQVKQQGMSVLMSAIFDRDDLDEADAQYMFGGMEESDLNSVMDVMNQGVMGGTPEKPTEKSTGLGTLAAMKEAEF